MSNHPNRLLIEESSQQLGEVKVSVTFPKRHNDGSDVKFLDLKNFLLDRIELDIHWWNGIDRTEKVQEKPNIYEQDLKILFLNIFHRIEVIESGITEDGWYFTKTVGYPRGNQGLQMSYIAYYRLKEDEDGFVFELIGKLEVPKLLTWLLKPVISIIAKQSVAKSLKRIVMEQEYLDYLLEQ